MEISGQNCFPFHPFSPFRPSVRPSSSPPPTLCFAQTKLFSKFIGTDCTAARHPRDDLWSRSVLLYYSILHRRVVDIDPRCLSAILIVKKVYEAVNRWNVSIIVVTGRLTKTIKNNDKILQDSLLRFSSTVESNGYRTVSKYTIKRDKIAAPVSIFALSRINHLISERLVSTMRTDASSFSRSRHSLSLPPSWLPFNFRI